MSDRRPTPNTVADGYSRTDQRQPIATSTTPVAPPLAFDYNDGVAEDFDDGSGYGAAGDDGSSDGGGGLDASGSARSSSPPLRPGEAGFDRHLAHPDRPTLDQTHPGEHRSDHGDEGALATTRSTQLFAFCAALNSCNLGYDIGVNTGAGMLVQSSLSLSDMQLEVFMGSLNLFAMVSADKMRNE